MTFKDHFSGHADEYAHYRPTYPAELFHWLADQCDGCGTAWDCATGNGQAARAMSERFDRVFATDASANQIGQAVPKEGVNYIIAPAEDCGLKASSIDLVTVAQALHWFDLARFYAEVDRVLKPGGVLAVWAYGLATCGYPIDTIVANYYEHKVGPFWPPERNLVEKKYATIPFPYPKETVPSFEMVAPRTLEQLLGYLRTWSASKRFAAELGYDPVTLVEAAIAEAWPKERLALRFITPIYLLVGRKPTA